MITSTPNRATIGKILALAFLLATLTSPMLAARPADASTTFTVNSTEDHADANLGLDGCHTGYTVKGSGGAEVPECTLRAALNEANYTSGGDVINFAIPGSGVKSIAPESALPAISEAVTIDGYSQGSTTADPADDARPNTLATGAINAVPKIELNGQNAGPSAHGLEIQGSNSVVRGLVINRFDYDGIHITGPGNKVQGNFIGTDPSGTLDLGNRYNGVKTKSGGNSNTVGGSSPAARNLISGNGADNGGQGVDIDGGEGNRVLGNLIGTKKDGAGPLGNSDGGVEISDVSNTTVGGTTAATRNVISGNGEFGVEIFGANASGNKIMGNYIGTDASGTKDLGNSFSGVYIGDAPNASGAPNNTVGGTMAGAGNVISGNDGSGIEIHGAGATGNRILSNSIFSNGELGIDLYGTEGPTPNDPGDADTGANGLQNKPVISSAKKGATGTTTVRGSLNSTPGKTFTVQFFSNPEGGDEGKTLLGSKTVTTGGTGNVSITFSTTKAIRLGQNITATAINTSTGDTSEFSAPRKVVAQ